MSRYTTRLIVELEDRLREARQLLFELAHAPEPVTLTPDQLDRIRRFLDATRRNGSDA